MTDYAKAKQDILRWLKEDRRPEARFTTMFDLYALPDDFPDFAKAEKHTDPLKRVVELETAFAADISDGRFIPYLQLHEFEALLLSDPATFQHLPAPANVIQSLADLSAKFPTPEHINDKDPPSKRIIGEFPDYDKVADGARLAGHIGLPAIRQKCPHFNDWLTRLKALARPQQPALP